jgi:hypothetical protein
VDYGCILTSLETNLQTLDIRYNVTMNSAHMFQFPPISANVIVYQTCNGEEGGSGPQGFILRRRLGRVWFYKKDLTWFYFKTGLHFKKKTWQDLILRRRIDRVSCKEYGLTGFHFKKKTRQGFNLSESGQQSWYYDILNWIWRYCRSVLDWKSFCGSEIFLLLKHLTIFLFPFLPSDRPF